MADLTTKDKLDEVDPNDFWAMLRRAGGIGTLLESMVNPTEVTRTGLASNATQVHNIPGIIQTVSVGGVARTIVDSTVTAGATTVSIEYTAGVATLTFSAVQTGYTAVTVGSQTTANAGIAVVVNPQ